MHHRIIKEFLSNREPTEYLDLIDSLLTMYVTSDDYRTLAPSDQCQAVQKIIELKSLIKSVQQLQTVYGMIGVKPDDASETP